MTRVRKTRRSSWCLRIAVLLLLAFIFIKGMQVLAQIKERQSQIDELNRQIAVAQLYNEDLEEKSKNSNQYLEERLRENNYVRPNDQVYQFSN